VSNPVPAPALTTEAFESLDVETSLRSPKPLSFGASGAHSGPDALLNQRTLKLRHCADDLEHQPTGRRREVEVISEADVF
jgi:hypothetical protein